jgi:FKBP-type peptidyl-prolyl cis-trans isomerase FkpA
MKTSLRSLLLGAALLLSGCPSESAKDASPVAVAKPPETAVVQPKPVEPPPPPPPISPEDRKKALYAFGAFVAERTPVKSANLTEAEYKEVLVGLNDSLAGKELKVKMEDAGPLIDRLFKMKTEESAVVEKKKSAAFLAKALTGKGAKKTASGLIYTEMTPGKGENPKPTDMVSVHYKGTLIDGTEFDSSYKRNAPADFPLNGVIKCWTEGVGMMKPGGKAKLVCPSDIAYGDQGRPPQIAGGATLVFEVELLSVKAPPPPPPPGSPMPGLPPGHPQ